MWAENGTTMATADFAGDRRRICLAYLPDLAVGDFVIVHAGFALTQVAPAEAAQTLAVMRQYGILDDPARPVEGGAA